MKILAVETSGKTFSVALNENAITIASSYYDYGNIHSEIIISAIERLLKDTKNTFDSIDKFAVSIGPGSFTGIRVGMTAVKIFAQILNKPIIAVDTLSILKGSLIQIKSAKIIPAIDALRNEIYMEHNGEIVIKGIASFIEHFKKYKNRILIIGTAAIAYKEKFSKQLGKYSVSLPYDIHIPKASTLATLAFYSTKDKNFGEVKPLYIRRSWAEEAKGR